MSDKQKDGGGSTALGLSERQGFDGKKQGNTQSETGIPNKVKAEKSGKHTFK